MILGDDESSEGDLRNHRAIVQPRLYDCLMVTQVTLIDSDRDSDTADGPESRGPQPHRTASGGHVRCALSELTTAGRAAAMQASSACAHGRTGTANPAGSSKSTSNTILVKVL